MLQGLVGATESSSSSGFSKNATGSSSSGTVAAGISVGDRVVRGPAWNWGDQDGGPGGYGTVIDVRGVDSIAFQCIVKDHASNRISSASWIDSRRMLYMNTYDCRKAGAEAGSRKTQPYPMSLMRHALNNPVIRVLRSHTVDLLVMLVLCIQIRTWKGKSRSGIKVRWADTTFVGLYRYASAFRAIHPARLALPNNPRM